VPVGEVPATVAVNVTGCPAWLGLSDDASATVLPAMVTVCVRGAEVLAMLLASPPYSAVIECAAALSDDVVKLAVPPLTGSVPSTVAPSLNVTVPVGELPVTVAVNVTACPAWLGLREEVSVVAVGLVTVRVAVSDAVPPWKERVAELVLVPTVVAVTLTSMMHVASNPSEGTLKLTEPPPAAAVAVLPLHPLEELSGMLSVATTTPDGRALSKFTLFAWSGPGPVVILYVSVAVPPTEIEDGLNDISKSGDWADADVADRAAKTSTAANAPNQREIHARRDIIQFPTRTRRS
jgi:hypothetical protein